MGEIIRSAGEEGEGQDVTNFLKPVLLVYKGDNNILGQVKCYHCVDIKER